MDEDLEIAASKVATHPLIHKPVGLELPMLSWLAVHANLVLALRHPQNTTSSRQITEDVVAGLEGLFLDKGILTEEEIVAMHRLDTVPRSGS